MSDASDPAPDREEEPAWKRRQRLARIFGDVLPDTTADERDPEDGAAEQARAEAWLKSQVPPHHG